jgi:integrase
MTLPINPAELAAAEAGLAEALARYRAAGGMTPRVWMPEEPTDQASPGPVPFDQFKTELLELYGPTMRARGTRREMVRAIGIIEGLGVQSTADLQSPSLVARLIATCAPGRSPNTVRKFLRQLSVMCSHAVHCGYARTSPFSSRPVRSWIRAAPSSRVRHLTRAEIRRILNVLDDDVRTRQGWALWRARRLQCLVYLVAFTGLRRSEALHLRTEDIDIQARSVSVVDRATHRLKTSTSAALVPCPEQLIPVLTDWLAHRQDAPEGSPRPELGFAFPNSRIGTPWTGGCRGTKPLDRLRAIGERAQVKDLGFQILRRSVATHLELSGCGGAMISRILRHSPRVDEDFYRKADLANMIESVKGLRY